MSNHFFQGPKLILNDFHNAALVLDCFQYWCRRYLFFFEVMRSIKQILNMFFEVMKNSEKSPISKYVVPKRSLCKIGHNLFSGATYLMDTVEIVVIFILLNI